MPRATAANGALDMANDARKRMAVTRPRGLGGDKIGALDEIGAAD